MYIQCARENILSSIYSCDGQSKTNPRALYILLWWLT